MTIISLKIGHDIHDYLLTNSTVKSSKVLYEKPVYVNKGDVLTYVTDLYARKKAKVVDIIKTDVLPQSVSKYIEIVNDALEVCGMPITGELRKKLAKQF